MNADEMLEALNVSIARAEKAEVQRDKLVAALRAHMRANEEQRLAQNRTNAAKIDLGLVLDEVTR